MTFAMTLKFPSRSFQSQISFILGKPFFNSGNRKNGKFYVHIQIINSIFQIIPKKVVEEG